MGETSDRVGVEWTYGRRLAVQYPLMYVRGSGHRDIPFMHQPLQFEETRVAEMHALMRSHPLAMLVADATGRLDADHVPLVLHEDGANGTLRGHVATGNPLVRDDAGDGAEVLAIFRGPQGYVTPSWYASKREHGKVVPTWNYVAVHARGRIRLVRETEWLMRHLEALTAEHESHRALPWGVGDAPARFIERMLRGLVGFEIVVEDLQGTWKMSQNKSDADRDGVVRGFGADGEEEIARLVAERAG